MSESYKSSDPLKNFVKNMIEFLPIILFITVLMFIMLGYPVAFTLGGIAIIFGIIGIGIEIFSLLTLRKYGCS